MQLLFIIYMSIPFRGSSRCSLRRNKILTRGGIACVAHPRSPCGSKSRGIDPENEVTWNQVWNSIKEALGFGQSFRQFFPLEDTWGTRCLTTGFSPTAFLFLGFRRLRKSWNSSFSPSLNRRDMKGHWPPREGIEKGSPSRCRQDLCRATVAYRIL